MGMDREYGIEKAKAKFRERIKNAAIEAGLPSGWYEGPSFNNDGELVTGMPNQLIDFVENILEEFS